MDGHGKGAKCLVLKGWWSFRKKRPNAALQLGGGNSNLFFYFYFHPDPWGRWVPNFDFHNFSNGLVQPPTGLGVSLNFSETPEIGSAFSWSQDSLLQYLPPDGSSGLSDRALDCRGANRTFRAIIYAPWWLAGDKDPAFKCILHPMIVALICFRIFGFSFWWPFNK